MCVFVIRRDISFKYYYARFSSETLHAKSPLFNQIWAFQARAIKSFEYHVTSKSVQLLSSYYMIRERDKWRVQRT